MDHLFQFICNIFPHYKLNNKYKKKFFYLIYCIFKFFIKGPFVLNFKDFKFFSYPQKTNYSRFLLSRVEMPDKGEINFINKNIDDNSIFLDCGANQGFYSIPIAAKNNLIDVHSFEPSDKEFELLKDNIKINNLKNITLRKNAILDKIGKVNFFDTNSNINDTSGGVLINSNDNINKTKEVEGLTLDSYVKKINVPLDKKILIKIDIEGYDIHAIYGAKEIINKYFCIVIFEFSILILENKNFNLDEFQNFLSDNKLIIKDFNNNEISVKNLLDLISKLDKKHSTIGNYILLKKDFNGSLKF